MPVAVEKEDSRSIKTVEALNGAMLSLLESRNFRNITIKDICEEALVSRATFYTHFTDKYDFLKWWLLKVYPDDLVNKEDIYEVMAQKINQYMNENKAMIKHLFIDADSWTLDALFDVFYIIMRMTTDKTTDGLANPKYIVLSNFYISGMIHYIMWQAKNDFPQNVTAMNNHVYEVIKIFQEWD